MTGFESVIVPVGGARLLGERKRDRGRETKIREERKMEENRDCFEIYYFNVLYDKIKVEMSDIL